VLKDHAKIIHAIALSGEVIGRKKLQKMIYIAKKMNFPFQERFQFHFYGPYSEELTLRVEELCNMGFINEVKEQKGGYYQYRYTLTEAGEEFLGVHSVDMPCLGDCLGDINSQNARFLELVSTILYFDNLPEDEVKEKVLTVKKSQKYTDEEFANAYQYIESLKGRTRQ
jgi:uncharacterized protein YwgA